MGENSMNKQCVLVLVRHGESLWNAKGLWTGWTDIGLSDLGKKEAQMAAKELAKYNFDIAFTSDLSRAYETLNIIKKELKLKSLKTVESPALKERNYGVYTGKNKWDMQKILGVERFNKVRRGWDVPIPEGETLKVVYDRVVSYFIKNIKPELDNGKNVLIVAHGNTNRALMKYLEEVPDELVSDIELITGEIVTYQFDVTGKVIKTSKKGK
jgi:2,3-bisphosphoglycerate-dependent phosphoglycerate mutase